MWTCKNCGLSVRVSNASLRVKCSCGLTDNRDGTFSFSRPQKQTDRASGWLTDQRKATCVSCDSYMGGDRCKKVSLGCRAKYIDQISSRDGECPLGKWDNKWKPVDDIVSPMSNKLIITVGTGSHFEKLLDVTSDPMRAYASRCGADFVSLTNKTQSWWGLEKFRVKRFAEQYDRTLFLDADVIVSDRTPDIFDFVPAGTVGIHDDWRHLNAYDLLWSERGETLKSQDVEMDHTEHALNSGVVLCDREHASVWNPPPLPVPTSHCAEQFWVEHSARKLPLTILPTEWNCQWWMPRFKELVDSAFVIHLANCPNDQRVELAKRLIAERS